MNLFLRFVLGAVCLLPLVGCSDDDTEGNGARADVLTFNSRLWS